MLSPASIHAWQQAADQCVMCGMCLTVCPTYLKQRQEGESPRGRIALIMALARGDLAPAPRLGAYLVHCLVCRACERICPSGVPYGQLIDTGRELFLQLAPPSLSVRLMRRILLDGLIAHPGWIRRLGWVLYALQRTQLIRLAPLLGLGRLTDLLPALPAPHPWRVYYPARGMERGRVALFIGCLAGVMDRLTLEAAITVLTHLGYGVMVPPRQGCCGALHLHNGDVSGAQRLIQRNIAAFSEIGDATIVTTASGCGATLMEYPTLADRVMDISDFLTQITWPTVVLRPLLARVAIHDPCSLTNVLRRPASPYLLLQRIPDLTVLALPGNHQCCGGAGASLLTTSAVTQALRLDKITALRALAPDILVSSNLGCALHLAQGTHAMGMPVAVMHPVTLLAQQLTLT